MNRYGNSITRFTFSVVNLSIFGQFTMLGEWSGADIDEKKVKKVCF